MHADAVVTETARSRLRHAVRSPTALVFGGLLAAAVALRAYAVVSWYPAGILTNAHDGAAYVRAAHFGLGRGGGAQEPPGYPLFLKVVHAVSDQLAFTIAVQHVLALAAGTLFFLTVRRAGGPRWLGLVPAAVVWFNADGLFLEHVLLTESVFTFFLALALYVAVRTQERSSVALVVLAGILVGGLPVVRTVGLPLVPVVLVCLAIIWWRAGLPWLRNLGVAAASTVVVLGAYAALWHHTTGRWALSPEGGGWSLYARASAFADCNKFTPPKGTAFLCERTPPDKRPGGLFYAYHGGPAFARFGFPVHGDAVVGRFGRAAIVHQPLDFLDAVWIDVRHYFSARAGPSRYLDYPGAHSVEFPPGPVPIDPDTLKEVLDYYAPFRLPGGTPTHGLYRYQHEVFRVPGGLLLALLVLGLVGVVAATGRVRWTIGLLLAVALELILAPALIHTEWRFTVPADGPAAGAAALGGWALFRRFAASERLRALRRPPARQRARGRQPLLGRAPGQSGRAQDGSD